MFFLKQEEVKKLHFGLSEDEKESILEEILVGMRQAHSACLLCQLCGHASSLAPYKVT